MAQFQLETKNHNVLFIGIAGIGMKPLSMLYKKAGFNVFGYDKKLTNTCDNIFNQSNIKILTDNFETTIKEIDYVIYSTAIPYSNKILDYSRKLLKKTLTRSEGINLLNSFLGKSIISISGTNGKGAITSMLACLFDEGKRSPTVLCGANMKNYDNSYLFGKGNDFIIEACEYKEEFDKFPHQIFIVSNIGTEHLDYYKGGIKEIVYAFLKQVDKTIANKGLVISNNSNIMFNKLTLKYRKSKNFIGLFNQNSNWEIVKKKIIANDFNSNIEIWKDGKIYDSYILDRRIFPFFENILFAVILADYFSISKKQIRSGLAKYKGLTRRFENFMLRNKNVLIYDYASHPDTIKNSISFMKEIYQDKSIITICTFKQYHRVKSQLSIFANVLAKSDRCLLLPVTPGLGDKMPYDSFILQDLKESIDKKKCRVITLIIEGQIKVLYELIEQSTNAIFYLAGTGDNSSIFNTIIANEAI